MVDDDTSYPLTNAEPETGERFAGLEDVFDPVTRRHLTRLGVAPGARCLAVGAGSGSIDSTCSSVWWVHSRPVAC